MNRQTIIKTLVGALVGFILWTAFLSPYMIFVVQTTGEQFVEWLIMQGVLIPPIAPVVVWVTNKITKRLG